MNKNFDFMGIGDITNDAFIRIKEANVIKDSEGNKSKLCLNFADKIPYESVTLVKAVGNAPNATVAAKRLGLDSAIVTNLGDDDYGKDCVKALMKEGIDVQFVDMHKGKETNYNFLILYEEERTILSKHREYTYNLPNIGSPNYIYFSSLGKDSLPYHNEIVNYIKKHPEIKLVFQPGTFQIKIGYEPLRKIYELAEILFCNKKEAQRILETNENDIIELLKEMHKLGPKIVVITDGVKGSFAYDGNEGWQIPMYPDIAPPVDRTGAGDSFSSTFTTAIILGKTIPEALRWGPVNSMSVVQHIGAHKGLLTRKELEKYLVIAPDYYKLTKII